MKRMTVTRFAVILVFSLAVAASAKAQDTTKFDRFRLWNKCTPLRIATSEYSKEANKMGLTEKAILSAVRSRLRAARIYTDKEVHPPSFLAVKVTIGEGGIFNVAVELNKYLQDDFNEISDYWRAVTWQTSSFGTHGGSASYVLSVLSQKMDTFIDEYLRVNAPACKS